MNNYKICFITSKFGINGDQLPKLFRKNKKYDYFLFTDINPEKLKTSWDIIQINDNFFKNKENLLENINNNVIKSRLPKFMGWLLLKDYLDKEYDVIFYCDCYLVPKININWDKIADNIYNSKNGIWHRKHDLVRI